MLCELLLRPKQVLTGSPLCWCLNCHSVIHSRSWRVTLQLKTVTLQVIGHSHRMLASRRQSHSIAEIRSTGEAGPLWLSAALSGCNEVCWDGLFVHFTNSTSTMNGETAWKRPRWCARSSRVYPFCTENTSPIATWNRSDGWFSLGILLGKFWWIFGTFRWCCFLFRVFFDLWGILRDFWWFLSFFGQEFWRSWLILGQMFEDVLVMFDDFLVTFGEFWWFCGISIMLWSIVFFTIKLRVFFAGQDSGSWPSTLISPEMGLELQKGLELELIPFGKHLHNDEKSPCYSWENPL